MPRLQAFVVALLLCWTFPAAAEVAVPPLTGRVVDLTGTLSAADIATQSQRLRDLETRKGSQVAVLMVPTTQPETIEQYSLRVAETWKIGRRKIDDGALVVIAKDDHKLRIEVGYGLEGALTDVTARRIIDEVIAPHFKSGDFAGGIAAGITRIIGVIDGEPLPRPAPEASHGQDNDLTGFLNPLNPFTIFIVVVVGTIMRKTLGRLFGAVAAGGAMAAFAWFVAGSIVISAGLGALVSAFTFFADGILAANQAAVRRSGRGGGGWSGGWVGGGGGGGWGGGSSDGGFSGGGGSFGGGGASGSW
jgi:uncharacterized protein